MGGNIKLKENKIKKSGRHQLLDGQSSMRMLASQRKTIMARGVQSLEMKKNLGVVEAEFALYYMRHKFKAVFGSRLLLFYPMARPSVSRLIRMVLDPKSPQLLNFNVDLVSAVLFGGGWLLFHPLNVALVILF
ncbi:hypothetical protein ACQ4PT_045153 [Festuca glaucescens]